MGRRIRYPVALFAGATTTLAFAPFNYAFFAILSPALLWWLLREEHSPARALMTGWLFGLGFFGAGVSWVYVSIHTYGQASVPLAAGLTGAFCAALALLFGAQSWIGARWFRSPATGWLAFTGLWVGFEWLRSWLLTGFPWLYLGYGWTETPLASLAPLTGVWGLSLISVLLAAGIVEALAQRNLRPLLPGVILALCAWLPFPAWTQASAPPLQVALVQPNVPQMMKWAPQARNRIVSQLVTLSLPHRDADMIIWPENAIPAFYYQVAGQLSPLLENSANARIITGLPSATKSSDAPGRTLYHNSLAVLNQPEQRYHKRRLVPFGEYVPLEAQLRGLIEFFNLPMSSFSLPEKDTTLLQVGDHRLAPAICYEIAYPELVRDGAREADAILTLSNDTWFGRSIGPDQHLQMAQMRALENGRWVIRSTNNGITALIDESGRIRGQLPVDQTAVLTGEVQPMTGTTPYQRAGTWPVLGVALLLTLCPLLQRVRTARKHHSAAATGFDL
jgi:apolipoprotein N-acyltransferase